MKQGTLQWENEKYLQLEIIKKCYVWIRIHKGKISINTNRNKQNNRKLTVSLLQVKMRNINNT